jgi:hypothetical protein
MGQTSPTEEAAKSPQPARKRAWLGPLLTFLVLLVAFLTNHQKALDTLKQIDAAAAGAIGSLSIEQFAAEFTDRFASCDYAYLVICEPKPKPACASYQPARTCYRYDQNLECTLEVPTFVAPLCVDVSQPVESVMPKQLDILLHLPDAVLHVLWQRLQLGIVPFVLMFAFVVANLMIMGYALSNGIAQFWASILLAPLATSALFWLIKQLLIAMTLAVGLFLQAFIIIAGLPLLLIWLKSAQEAHSLYVAAKDLLGTKRQEK